jgi:chorismate mutase/catechol 2,3-dioxygenase-like lactoylglutathione lyase family enzyme
MSAPRPELGALRREIDEIDAAIVELLGRRMAVCREVARVKAGAGAGVIQPERVREVLATRREWAGARRVDPDFADQLFRVLLAETHRLALAEGHGAAAPTAGARDADPLSELATVACRIDHVVVAVAALAPAVAFLRALGFAARETADPGIVTCEAGGVSVVLVGPGDPAVDAHLAAHGSGVQHIAIEVLDADHVRGALARAGVPLLTDVVVDSDGHAQVFTVLDPSTGVQLGFISRTGSRVPVNGQNVRALFRALR